MPQRRPLLQTRAVRLPGDGPEEYRVGAYARRQLVRRAWFGLFGVALVFGAWGLYLSLRPDDVLARGESYSVRARCTACGFDGDMTVALGTPPPLTCPRCKQAHAGPLWKCRACGEVFLPSKPATPVRCA